MSFLHRWLGLGGATQINCAPAASQDSQRGAAAMSPASTAAGAASPAQPASSGAGAAAAGATGSAGAGSVSLSPGVPNVSSCCPSEKWLYERCFQKWYSSEFLTGQSRDLSACAPLFDAYRACVLAHYEKHEPEVLVSAGATSDRLLVEDGNQPFHTKYPALAKQQEAAAREAEKGKKK